MKGGEKMQETNKMRDRLMGEFAENYMEKLFYFCLKKTGNNIEAEDLTQDISLQIITALNKGTIPTSFSASCLFTCLYLVESFQPYRHGF